MRDTHPLTSALTQARSTGADLTKGQTADPAAQVAQVAYHGGVPYYVGQQPQTVTVQLPEQSTISPWVRDLVVIALVLLVVLVVCTACVVAIVVMAGGTLMGIIGAAASAAVPVTIGLVATLVALGWAATRVRSLTQEGKTR